MKIQLTTLALQDLEEIRLFLAERSYVGLKNVLEDIETTIVSIPDNLLMGRQTPRDDVRERISPKYRYKIPYYVRGDVLYVLRIYHPKRKLINYDTI